jgi:hypothetical protein
VPAFVSTNLKKVLRTGIRGGCAFLADVSTCDRGRNPPSSSLSGRTLPFRSAAAMKSTANAMA